MKNNENEGESRYKEKDNWDKVSIILRPVGGLLAAIAITSLGFIGSHALHERQSDELNLRLYTELMSNREAAENSLRKDMFEKIFASFLEPAKKSGNDGKDTLEKELEQIESKLLSLELLTRNFHESLDIKPLFIHVLLEIIDLKREFGKRESPGEEEINKQDPYRKLDRYRKNLFKITERIRTKQREVLAEAGDEFIMEIPLGDLCDGKNPLESLDGVRCDQKGFKKKKTLKFGDDYEREFEIFIPRAYLEWNMLRMEVKATLRKGTARKKEDKKKFWMGRFDFPTVDNTYLSANERYAVIFDKIDREKNIAKISLVYFPASFTGLKEKSFYHQKAMQYLVGESKLFKENRPLK